jgi:uncharacterized protein (DUF1697 family)
VGRVNRLAMADLRALLESLGCSRVQTLLNSGNAVFDSPAQQPDRLAQRIRDTVAAKLGVDTLVIVKSAAEIASVVAGNPWRDRPGDPSRGLVALTQDAASLAAIGQMAWARSGADEMIVGPHAAYVWCPDGLLESPAAVALLKGLADAGTTRNAATIDKIHALLQGAG